MLATCLGIKCQDGPAWFVLKFKSIFRLRVLVLCAFSFGDCFILALGVFCVLFLLFYVVARRFSSVVLVAFFCCGGLGVDVLFFLRLL